MRVAATTGGVTERMETSRRQNTAFMSSNVVHKMMVEQEGRKKKVMGSKNEKKGKYKIEERCENQM